VLAAKIFCNVKVNEIQEERHDGRPITKASGVGGKRFLISLVKCEFMEH
jgi:hypothetical protein